MLQIKLMAKSYHGKNRIAEQGNRWTVVRNGLSNNKPAMLCRPAQFDAHILSAPLRWIMRDDDPDFEWRKAECITQEVPALDPKFPTAEYPMLDVELLRSESQSEIEIDFDIDVDFDVESDVESSKPPIAKPLTKQISCGATFNLDTSGVLRLEL